MKWFIDLKIKTKLAAGFFTLIAMFGFVAFYAYTTFDELGIIQDKGTQHVEDILVINASQLRINDLYAVIADGVINKNYNETHRMLQSWNAESEIAAVKKTASTAEEIKIADEYATNYKNMYSTIINEYYPLLGNTSQSAMSKISEVDGVVDTYRNAANSACTSLAKQIQDEIRNHDVAFDKDRKSAQTMIGVILVLGIISAIFITMFISNMISKPVQAVIENITNADLNSQFNSDRKDEIGDLQKAFDKFVDSIKETLIQVAEASSAVASASTEISSSTEQMAAGAQEQSSQAGEVAAAVEEMTKTINENATNATSTASTAKKAKEAAESGGHIVKGTVEGMREIAKVVNKSAETVKALGKSSDQIGEIIGVIDDIADQTNLLALNAAIEAARAGEQGRGFAVVADEVRKLAERTTKATKEIATMIKQIQQDTKGAVLSMNEGTTKVDEGIILADKAGDSLKDIVKISQEVTDMVTQIAAGSEQQSSASEQISKNVEAISTVTQQSASGIQQIARTAEDLNRLTINLQELLGKFNLGSSESKSFPSIRKAQKTFSNKSLSIMNKKERLVESY